MRSTASLITVAILAALFLASSSAVAAPVVLKKSVTRLEDGSYTIKIAISAREAQIYAFEISDPKSSITDVYAPKSWCMLTDGGLCLARTSGDPISTKKTLEFIFHANAPDAQFIWTFFDALKQISAPEVL